VTDLEQLEAEYTHGGVDGSLIKEQIDGKYQEMEQLDQIQIGEEFH
jgi:hypothetical protein